MEAGLAAEGGLGEGVPAATKVAVVELPAGSCVEDERGRDEAGVMGEPFERLTELIVDGDGAVSSAFERGYAQGLVGSEVIEGE